VRPTQWTAWQRRLEANGKRQERCTALPKRWYASDKPSLHQSWHPKKSARVNDQSGACPSNLADLQAAWFVRNLMTFNTSEISFSMKVYRWASNKTNTYQLDIRRQEQEDNGKTRCKHRIRWPKRVLTHPHWTRVPFGTLRIVRFKLTSRALSELPWNVLQVVIRR
jgi:hypothetical protein